MGDSVVGHGSGGGNTPFSWDIRWRSDGGIGVTIKEYGGRESMTTFAPRDARDFARDLLYLATDHEQRGGDA